MPLTEFDADRPLVTLRRLLAPSRGRLLFAFLLYGVKHSPVWLLPVVTADAIDVVVAGGETHRLLVDGLLLLALVGQNLPVNIWFAMTLSKVLRNLELRLRSALTERVQELSIGFWNRMKVGGLQSKVVRDVENIEQGLRQAGNGGFAAIFNLVGAVTVTALKVPQFLGFFVLVVPLAAAVMMLARRRLHDRNEAYRSAVEQMATRTTEMMGLVPITRAHGLERTALETMTFEYDRTKNVALRLDFVNASFGALSWVVFNIANGLCLLTAAWAATTGAIDISAGEVVMLTTYFTVLSSAVIMLTDLAPNFARALASVRSISEVLSAVDLEPNRGKRSVEQVQGLVEFRDVTFGYEGANQAAVSQASLKVAPGEYVAIAGPSGAGKSTLANLLIGFIRPQSGEIYFDGIPGSTIDYRSLRRFISVVPQESVMFEGTVAENVGYGDVEVSPEELQQALVAANAWEFVKELPQGTETEIGPRGYTLSGGQKQRLAIARALLRNPRILVLDEATSSLDTQSEALVQEALERLMAGRTTFVIAHRLSTIRNADCIHVMEEGRIVESGSHEDLMTRGGLYSQLHASLES